MPGYFVHIASAPQDLRSSALGLKGLIAPDLWKKHTPTESEYFQFFTKCSDAPSYEQIKFLCSAEHGGTHFGSKLSDTNHADFAFISNLFTNGQLDADNLFFKGYIHHLRVDKNFYADIPVFNKEAYEKDSAIDKKVAIEDLHFDWDKTNFAISNWYPEIVDLLSSAPEEVQKVIGFAKGDTKYVTINPMRHFIENMRESRSIEELLNS